MPTVRVLSFVVLSWGVAAAPAAAQLTADDAIRVIRTVYDQEGFDITGRSTREQRNAFLMRAAGIVHFGHPAYNATPDPRWCVKDAGQGRPMADDVLVRCDTREAWDFVAGIGGSSPIWATTFIGTLPSMQNVYPPLRPEPYTGSLMALRGSMVRPRVTLSWTPAALGPSTVSYTLDVRSPSALRVPLGQQTGLAADAPDGVYTLAIEAAFATGIVVRSNSVVIPVGAFALPGPPVGLTATTNGPVVSFQWQPPLSDGGAPVQAFVLEAGTSPGRSDLAVLPIGAALSFVTPPLPDGNYFVRVRARTVAGVGPASADVRASVGPPPPAAPMLTGSSAGGAVSLQWSVPVTGAPPTGYRVFVGSQPQASDIADIPMPIGTTSLGASGVPAGTYFVRVAATSAVGLGLLSNELVLIVP